VRERSSRTRILEFGDVGKVYTFNVFSEEMEVFSVNGLQTSPIPAWSGGVNAPLFTPASLAIDRTLNTSTGVFFNGKNRVILRWPSGIFTFELIIDGNRFPITQNLVLIIMQGRWQFINSYGTVVDEGLLKAGTAALLREIQFSTPH